MNKSILVALAAISLTACRNDDDNNSSVANDSVILPTKIFFNEYENNAITGTSTLNFSYNGDKISTITGTYGSENNKVTFEYTGDLITKMTSTDGSDKTETVFTYTNGKLTSSKENGTNTDSSNSTYSNTFTSTTTYTYNADGTVSATKIKEYTYPNNTALNNTSTTNYVYTLSNGQISKNVATYIQTPTDHIETTSYTYDTKNSVLKNVRGFNALVLDLNNEMGEVFSLTQNNYTEVSWTDGTSTSKKAFTYEYNANNYPTKIVETSNGKKEGEYTVTYNK